ncbi:DoxX family protein [Planomonospora sp. ID82291]|uniref:DoxX family protein n=1 Tax=Planomonospora sp. ID82291 TaxID=2738136 RepID=UPI0018C3E0F9|nr:DoxX family protein [Planomonospora sp. ID82291]MBG0812726.1 DoxX family protein [Planomonospora sp. ID82291]
MRQTLHDIAALAARLGVGGIFFANGWDKLEAGLTATGLQFATLGAPAPGVWAATTMLTELIGGALLVAGLAVPVCGLLLFAEAVAVFVIANGDQGLPLTGGEVNLIVALGAASVLLAVNGAGRLSVDHMVVIKRREAEAAEDFAADSEADDVLASLREPEASAPGAAPAPAPGAAPGAAVRRPGPGRSRASEAPDVRGTAGDGAGETAGPARPRGRRRDGGDGRSRGGGSGDGGEDAGTTERPAPGKRGDVLVAKEEDASADG